MQAEADGPIASSINIINTDKLCAELNSHCASSEIGIKKYESMKDLQGDRLCRRDLTGTRSMRILSCLS